MAVVVRDCMCVLSPHLCLVDDACVRRLGCLSLVLNTQVGRKGLVKERVYTPTTRDGTGRGGWGGAVYTTQHGYVVCSCTFFLFALVLWLWFDLHEALVLCWS